MAERNYKVFETLKADNKIVSVANGSSLQFFIKATYDELEKIFGEPTGKYVDDKVQAEWVIWLKDEGIVFTIYDYKDERVLDDITEFNVGCHIHSKEAVKKFLVSLGFAEPIQARLLYGLSN